MDNPLGLKAHHVTARVRNIDAIVAWYSDVLGLRLADRGERLGGAMQFATLTMPGYAISFVQLASPVTEVKPGQAFVPVWVHPVFSAPDPDKLYRYLDERGVRLATHGPKPEHVQTFLVYDCEGNELEIVPEESIIDAMRGAKVRA